MKSTFTDVRKLVSFIAERADQTERERRMPDDLAARLSSAGCYRMVTPVEHGGSSADLRSILQVIEILSRADGAIGWTISQAALTQVIFCNFPSITVREVFAGDPNVFGAGAFAPKGRATRQGDGWRVSGHWPFVTGCELARWFYVHCMIVQNRKIQLRPNGRPHTRMMLVPAEDVKILDTWRAVGLRGTGSHDIRISNAFCPERRSYETGIKTSSSRAILNIDYAGFFICSVAVGIAQGALDEVTALALSGKRPAFGKVPLAECPLFQQDLGKAQMMLHAARALLYAEADDGRNSAGSAESKADISNATVHATAFQVSDLATRVVTTAYNLASGSSVYDGGPVERRMRDILAAAQHAWNHPQHAAALGAALVGRKSQFSF